MRGLAVLGVLATLAPASAAADSLAPRPLELQWARHIAVAYWHVQQPPCGRERVAVEPLTGADASANVDSCTITFNAANDQRHYPVQTCAAYVHEFGHLLLGSNYFAAVNPADPAHSPDPSSIMYGAVLTPREEAREQRSVGCLPSLKPHRAYNKR